MPTTASTTTIYDGQSITAGGGPTTSSGVDVSAHHSTGICIKITNGATGPTAATEVQLEVSANAGTDYMEWGGPMIGGTANNGIYSWSLTIPDWVQSIRAVVTHGTDQNTTLDMFLSGLTAVH